MNRRKEDYGALVAQGALWERAGFNEWAKKSYEDFDGTHTKNKEKRYEGLARWAANRRAALKSYKKPIPEEPSVPILKLEADELSAQQAPEKLEEALKRINSAITIAPDDVTLYLSRARIYFQQGKHRECKSDCDRILSKAPNTALAYFCAFANKAQRGFRNHRGRLRKALEYNPSDGLPDNAFARVIRPPERKVWAFSCRVRSSKLLNRSASAENVDLLLPDIYYEIALSPLRSRRFRKAIEPLKTAIAIKDNDSVSTRCGMKPKRPGQNEAQVSCSLAGVHNRTAENKLRLDNAKALDAAGEASALTADEKQVMKRMSSRRWPRHVGDLPNHRTRRIKG